MYGTEMFTWTPFRFPPANRVTCQQGQQVLGLQSSEILIISYRH